MEINILFDLPNDLFIIILCNWLNLIDICNLDSAIITNDNNYRINFLTLLERLVIHKSQINYTYFKSIHFLKWIVSRKIHINHIIISRRFNEKLLNKLVNYSYELITDVSISQDIPNMYYELFSICKNIEILNINSNKLQDHHLVIISTHCTALYQLNLSYCENITDVGIVTIAKKCINLKQINLEGCILLTDLSIKEIFFNCIQLTHINLNSCENITNNSILAIHEKISQLTYCSFNQCSNLNNKILKNLCKRCKYLKQLSIIECEDITNKGIKYIAKYATNLQSLNINYCIQITDDSMIILIHSCKYLEHLYILGCTFITDKTLNEISKKCCQLKTIQFDTEDIFVPGTITIQSILELGRSCPLLTFKEDI